MDIESSLTATGSRRIAAADGTGRVLPGDGHELPERVPAEHVDLAREAHEHLPVLGGAARPRPQHQHASHLLF